MELIFWLPKTVIYDRIIFDCSIFINVTGNQYLDYFPYVQ